MTSNPYEVLGLTPQADSETIRARYLSLVREFSPERAPERFSQIREAYEQLRDPLVNLQSRLLDPAPVATFEGLMESFQPNIRGQRLATDVLMSLARKS